MDNPIAVCVDRNPFSSLDALVEAIAQVGFARVEWFEPGSADPWSGTETAPQLCALDKRHKLAPQYHGPYEAPFDLSRAGETLRPPQAIAATISTILDRAQRLEASLVTLHLGSCPAGTGRAAALGNVAAGIRLAVPELERRRMRLALENHTKAIITDALGDRPEDFEQVMAELPSPRIGRTLDLGHAHINNQLEEFLRQPFDRVFNIHLHDNLGAEDQHLPLGDGAIRWGEILPRIAGEGYRGPLTFEFFAPADAYLRAMAIVRNATPSA
ncbi:MAG: sugar phosphate isomerase/epimerase family protein [Candidatus Brocadiia bacterium]|jgi:sugar phosphate isomerase/epimerase